MPTDHLLSRLANLMKGSRRLSRQLLCLLLPLACVEGFEVFLEQGSLRQGLVNGHDLLECVTLLALKVSRGFQPQPTSPLDQFWRRRAKKGPPDAGLKLVGARGGAGGFSFSFRLFVRVGRSSIARTVRLALRRQDVRVVRQPVEQSGGELLIAEDLDPFAECQIGRDERRTALVAIGQQIEEQFTALSLEWHETQFVELCGAPHNSINVERLVMWSSGLADRGGTSIQPRHSTLLMDLRKAFRDFPTK